MEYMLLVINKIPELFRDTSGVIRYERISVDTMCNILRHCKCDKYAADYFSQEIARAYCGVALDIARERPTGVVVYIIIMRRPYATLARLMQGDKVAVRAYAVRACDGAECKWPWE